jgi:hypothetical protein
MSRTVFLLALLLGGCAVSSPPPAEMSPGAVRTAWLSKGHYVWQPLVPAAPAVRHVKVAKKDTTAPIATVPRVMACDLAGFHAGCATY